MPFGRGAPQLGSGPAPHLCVGGPMCAAQVEQMPASVHTLPEKMASCRERVAGPALAVRTPDFTVAVKLRGRGRASGSGGNSRPRVRKGRRGRYGPTANRAGGLVPPPPGRGHERRGTGGRGEGDRRGKQGRNGNEKVRRSTTATLHEAPDGRQEPHGVPRSMEPIAIAHAAQRPGNRLFDAAVRAPGADHDDRPLGRPPPVLSFLAVTRVASR